MRKLIIGMFLILLFLPKHTYANEGEVYVALGDSLAAGQTPYAQIDAGYTDFIALQLMRHQKLAQFSKELAFPGYRVQNVIDSIQTEQAQQLLKNATIVTISAGANNLLPLISHNPNAGTIAFSQLSANFALNEVRIQMKELLQQVKSKAPNATIYVMGYYFPYTSVHEKQMLGATKELALLNKILQQEANIAGVKYVDVYEVFGERSLKYLPNVYDVHPNQLGYRIMANEMLAQFTGDRSLQLTEKNMPQPSPKSFEDILIEQQASNEVAFWGNYIAMYDFPIPIK
jgi:lysophospholipase L1-like esterase